MTSSLEYPTAVIVGLEANGLGVARALNAHGIPCIGLAGPAWTPSCWTRACRIVRSTSWTPEGLVNDLKAIGRGLDRKAPLLITKDEPVLWTSQNSDELSELFEINLPDPDTVELLMSKHRFLDLARERGWPMPVSWTANSREELTGALAEITYPCILKPRVKNSAFRANAPRKAFKADNERELLDAYDLVAQWEKEVVVQEWINGGDDRVAFCLTYFDRDGEPLMLFPGRKLRQWPPEFGNTALCEPAPEEWRASMLRLTREMLGAVGYRGLGSMEFKMRPDGRPVIMEPTVGRTDYQSELAVLNGANIPLAAYCDLAGLDFDQFAGALQPPEEPVKLVDGMAELKASKQLVFDLDLRVRDWINSRRGRHRYMLLRTDDAGPFVASVCIAIKNVTRRLAGAILGEDFVRSALSLLRRERP